MEVIVIATSSAGSDTTMVASEGVAQSAPPAVQAAAPGAGRMEEDTARGTAGVVAVVERTNRGLPSGLVPGHSRSPARGEPPLHWMDPQDPTSTLISLDDAAESIERGSLDEGISAMMGVLDQARVILRDVIVRNGRVSA